MTDSIEKKCIANGVKLTDQRRTIARVISESKKTYGEADHPDAVSYTHLRAHET